MKSKNRRFANHMGHVAVLVGLAACPAPPTVEPVLLDFDDGAFDEAIVVGRSGDTLTVTFRPQVEGEDREPLSYRFDDDLVWTEPLPNGDGTYSVDVTGTNHRNRASLELYGCDVNGEAPCLPSGRITSTFVFKGEPTATIHTPRDSNTTVSLAVGETRPFAAWGTGADGEPSYAPVVWSVSDASVVTVDEQGVLVGQSVGETELTATADGITRSWTVTLSDQELGPPLEGAWPLADEGVFEERGSDFDVTQEINGKLAVRNGVPITVFRTDTDSLVVAEWTGTGFGYELLAQFPTDKPARAKVRQQADGRPYIVYEGLLPNGIVVSTRSPDGGPWSHHALPILNNEAYFERNPFRESPAGYLHDILVGTDDTIWVATHAQTDESDAAPDCERVYRMHQLGPSGLLDTEDMRVEGCLEGRSQASLSLVPDPEGDTPLIVGIGNGNGSNQLDSFRKEDGLWWPETWFGTESGYGSPNVIRESARGAVRISSGDDQEEAGVIWSTFGQTMSGTMKVYEETTHSLVGLEPLRMDPFGLGGNKEPLYAGVSEGNISFGAEFLQPVVTRDPWGQVAGQSPFGLLGIEEDNNTPAVAFGFATDAGRTHFVSADVLNIGTGELTYGVYNDRILRPDTPVEQGRRVFTSAPTPAAKQLTVLEDGTVLIAAKELPGNVGPTRTREGGLTRANDANAMFLADRDRNEAHVFSRSPLMMQDATSTYSSPDAGLTWTDLGASTLRHHASLVHEGQHFVASTDGVQPVLHTFTEPSTFTAVPLTLPAAQVPLDLDGWVMPSLGLVQADERAFYLVSDLTNFNNALIVSERVDGSWVTHPELSADRTRFVAADALWANDTLYVLALDDDGGFIQVSPHLPTPSRIELPFEDHVVNARIVDVNGTWIVVAGLDAETEQPGSRYVSWTQSSDAGTTWSAPERLRPAGGLHQEIIDIEVDDNDVLVLLGDNQRVDGTSVEGSVLPTLQRITP